MAGIAVTPINQTVQAWPISPAVSDAVVDAINEMPQWGYQGSASGPTPNDPNWELTVTKQIPATQRTSSGGWVVSDGRYVTVIDNNLDFVNNWTYNTPMVWEPTSTAPVATRINDSTVKIIFPQPTSANGPWAYAVTQNNITDDTSSAATLSGDPVVDDSGNVTLTVVGLTAAIWAFTVEADTQYEGVNATSLATNQVCLIPLDWAATTTAPTATAQSGLSIELGFTVPTSGDGPFTYAYTLTDETSGITGAPVAFTPTVTDDNASTVIDDVTEGHDYTAVVTVTDAYGQTASSLPTAAVTAIS